MKNALRQLAQWGLLFFIASCPSYVFGAGTAFEVDPTDKSMSYLGMIFGTVPGLPIISDASNPIFSQMIYILNQVVFALGLIIVSYTTLIGAINTAQEGEFLGRGKWHPILVPVRAAFGVFLLLPQATGFNWMQIGVMWFIVQGVGAANAMWQQVMIYNQVSGSIHDDTRKTDLANANQIVGQLFQSTLCMTALNDLYFHNSSASGLLQEPIQVFPFGGKVYVGQLSQAGLDPDKQALCGSFDPGAASSALGKDSGISAAARQQLFTSAIISAQTALEPAATEALSAPQTSWRYANTFVSAARVLENAAIQSSQYAYQSLDDFHKEAIKNGWIMAGSYYFQLVTGGRYVPSSVSIPGDGPRSDAIISMLGATLASQTMQPVQTKGAAYTQYVDMTIQTVGSSSGGSISLNAPHPSGMVGSIFGKLFGSLFSQIVENLSKHITQGDKTGDPVVSMSTFGSGIITITEVVFFAALGSTFALWLATSTMSCIQPMGHALNLVVTLFLPISFLIVSLLWVAGVTLGIYIPMIPYLVFTFGAINWILLVIEAVVASPLIALTLIVPSEDEIGKAGHAIVLLLGLFLRPALMVLGFVIAIQLLIVAVGMLNFAFWETMKASTGGAGSIGIFGLIAVLLIYAGVAIGIVHEAFSLIYLVPNKVLRWISGDASGEDLMGHVKELKGHTARGGGIGEGAMKGSLSYLKNRTVK